MISNILNQHPQVLSLSEFFSSIGKKLFLRRRQTGEQVWKHYSRPGRRLRLLLMEPFEELLYPFDDPAARFSRDDVPPVLCTTLPHLCSEYEALYDEIEPVVRRQPKQSGADHCRHLFVWLCERFSRSVWVERSGSSLLFAPTLLAEFPEARIVHVFRDGRETAVSMSRHYLFRTILATIRMVQFGPKIDVAAFIAARERRPLASSIADALLPFIIRPDRLPYGRLTLPDFASFWNAMIEFSFRILDGLPAEQVLHVKFETMQADPAPEIRRLIRFISPTLEDEKWLREVCSIPRRTPSKFARLEPGARGAVTEACRPGLQLLGYPA